MGRLLLFCHVVACVLVVAVAWLVVGRLFSGCSLNKFIIYIFLHFLQLSKLPS